MNVNDSCHLLANDSVILKGDDEKYDFLTLRKHLLPLGKALSVKCRSLGKYQLLIPLAKALVKAGMLLLKVLTLLTGTLKEQR